MLLKFVSDFLKVADGKTSGTVRVPFELIINLLTYMLNNKFCYFHRVTTRVIPIEMTADAETLVVTEIPPSIHFRAGYDV